MHGTTTTNIRAASWHFSQSIQVAYIPTTLFPLYFIRRIHVLLYIPSSRCLNTILLLCIKPQFLRLVSEVLYIYNLACFNVAYVVSTGWRWHVYDAPKCFLVPSFVRPGQRPITDCFQCHFLSLLFSFSILRTF